MNRQWLALVLILALVPAVLSAAEKDEPKVVNNLKGEKIGAKTDDNVVEREEQKMNHEGYSIHEKKMLKEEKHVFQAEVHQLMGLIINSLYSQRDIFLRELISNASDALDKIRFLSLTDPTLLGEGDLSQLDIRIKADEEHKILYIRDKGIGMTKQELITNLGTIAKSGTKAFLEQMSASADMNLIGQFGVGFYSAFLVADKLTVTSKSNDEPIQHIWESDASGDFVVGEDPDGNTLGRGTEIALHLKSDALEFLKQDVLKKLVTKYSEFINFPIYLWVSHEEERPVHKEEAVEPEAEKEEAVEEGEEKEEGEEEEEDEDEETEWVKVWDWVLLNDTKPIWTRRPSEIEEEEYNKFYRAFTKETQDPLAHVHFSAEGDVEFKCLLFIPPKAPSGMFDTNRKATVQMKLYVRRVFITDDFEQIVPRWLAFIKGVIDSDSLPLNVSREVLQKNQMVSIMNKKVVRKVISMMQSLAENDPEKFDTFWNEYGTHIKLGIIEDSHNRSRMSKLLKYHSSKTGKLTTLEDYVNRMKKGQSDIYYIATDTMENAKKSPLVEKLLKRGYEVLFMVDPIDEYALQNLDKYDNKWRMVNVAKEGLKLGGTDEDALKKAEEDFKPLTSWLKKFLGDSIDKAVMTDRLTRTPCALVSTSFGWTANMERLVKAQALTDKSMATMYKPKKVMEINPKHPIIQELNRRIRENEEDATAKDIANMLFDTAALRSGFELEKPEGFADLLTKMLQKNMGLDPNLEPEEEVYEEEEEVEDKDEKDDKEDKNKEKSEDDDDAGREEL